MGNVAGALAGKHVLLTGVTGFVGEALLQLLLTEVPDARLSLLIRPKGSTSGADRARALLGKDIFALAATPRPCSPPRSPWSRATWPTYPRCRATSTPSCTAPATCPSTRRSTRASAPTSWAPVTCSTGSARPAATSTTSTSPRRTSPAGGAAASPSAASSTPSTSTSELAWGLSQRTSVEHQSRSAAVLQKLRVARRAGAWPRRPAHGGCGCRGEAPGVGEGAAGPDRHRAGAQPGLDRLLHVHQGARRARRRGARPDRPGLDRPAEHHRVGPREALPRLDRGLQDGRAADPGLRPRRAAGVPGGGGHHRRHRARRPRGRGDRRGARAPARGRIRRRTSTPRRAPATR